MNSSFKLGTLATALIISGCTSPVITQNVKLQENITTAATSALNRELPINESTVGHYANTNAAASRQLNPAVAKRATRPWIGSKMIESYSDDELPPIFDETFKVNFSDASTGGKVSLGVFAERMTRMTGIPFRIKQDVYTLPATAAAGNAARTGAPVAPTASAGATAAGQSLPAPLAPLAPNAQLSTQSATRSPAADLDLPVIEMRWENATPRTMTDFVTARLGLSSAYRDGVLIIERYVTESFEIEALEGNRNFQMNLQGGSTSGSASSASGTSGATGSSQSNFKVDESGSLNAMATFLTSLQQMVQAVPGSFVTPNEGTGRVSVTTTKEAMQRVRQMVKSENESLSRQVRIQFDIYTVTSKDTDQKGIDWSLVLNSVSAKWGGSIASPTSLVGDTAGQWGMTILSSGNGGNPSSGTVGRFGGSNAAIQALHEAGLTVQHRPLEITTLNRQWGRKTMLHDQSYVARTSASTSTLGGTGSVGMEPANVVTGDRYMVQPAIYDNGTVQMRYGISMTNLVALTETTAGQGSTISRVKNPETSGGEDQSTVLLKPGQVMILTGMARYKAKKDSRRFSEGWSLLTGGSSVQELEREESMIVVRAVLLN